MRYLVIIFALLLGCGESESSKSSAGGSGGVTTSAIGGNGGGGSDGGGGAGGEPCVEPTPIGWLGPYQPYGQNAYQALTILPDEAGGLAGVGPRIGPFVCAHDFVQMGVSYQTFGYQFHRPAEVKVDLVIGGSDGAPAYPPTFAEAACHTDDASPACGPIVVEDNYEMTMVKIVPIHVEPGDVLYPTMQLDTEIGVVQSEPLSPNPGWYYAPPGSAAGGPEGLWAALDKPPPGVPPYHYAPVIRLYE